MLKRALAVGIAVLAVAASMPATAAKQPDAPLSPQAHALRVLNAERALVTAAADVQRLQAAPAAESVLDRVRLQLKLGDAQFRYRQAIRDEQVEVYTIAVDPALETAVVRYLPDSMAVPVTSSTSALRSLWKLSGIDDLSLIRIRHNRDPADSAAIPTLVGYYRQAAGVYSMDWTYLASINFIESDFGRVNGPSSAGAEGPMQFMPGTWAGYGSGNVWSPHDSILAAARYLAHNGAPRDMGNAIWHYNQDWDYVDAVMRFATAIRQDPSWVDRLYYWSTFG